MKKILFFIGIISITSCTDILDNIAEQNVVGLWHLTTVKDVATGNETSINLFSMNNTMFSKIGTGINLSDTNFDIFLQGIGEDGNDGTYDVDILTLTLTFNNGTEIVRTIKSAGETELIVEDTINNKAKLLTFVKQ